MQSIFISEWNKSSLSRWFYKHYLEVFSVWDIMCQFEACKKYKALCIKKAQTGRYNVKVDLKHLSDQKSPEDE